MKTWKYYAIVSILGIIVFVVTFTACDNGTTETTHTHQWENWQVTTEPTCTEVGIETRFCTLDSSHKETRVGAVALGHNWEWITSTGIEAKTCSRCGEIDDLILLLNIGETGPGGGKIFYRNKTGFTMTDDNSIAYYLEAAPADMPSMLEWAKYVSSTDISPAYDISDTGTIIGTGRKNTTLILAMDATAPAAKACNDYSNNGKTDWFLPSKDELNELYMQMGIFNNWGISNYVSGDHRSWYLSSSVTRRNLIQVFDDDEYFGGGQFDFYLGGKYSVRAVRAF
jgi:hypothetical protein